jgi:MoxR-like ATPase
MLPLSRFDEVQRGEPASRGYVRLLQSPLMPSQTTDSVQKLTRLEAALRSVIRGQDEVVRLALVSLLGRGHLLIEGVPGVGKTTLAHTLARALDCSFHRIQFTSDMLPSDVLGISIYSAIEQKFEFKRGPVFTNILLADEINRTTPKTQSALLEAMNENQVTVDNFSYPLPQPFLVIATQNPIEHHGTYPLPESQMDRFLVRARMTYPEAGSEREILRSEAGAAQLDQVHPVLTADEVLALQDEISQVAVDDSLISYVLEIVRKTRESEYLSLGVSPRGSLMLYRAAQAMAFLAGRTFAIPEDFKSLAVPVLAHRVVVNARYSSTSKRSDQANEILREIVESVAVPV